MHGFDRTSTLRVRHTCLAEIREKDVLPRPLVSCRGHESIRYQLYVVRSIGSAILMLVPKVRQRGMLQRLPQRPDEALTELGAHLGIVRQGSHKSDNSLQLEK